jgi:hypothetical protein
MGFSSEGQSGEAANYNMRVIFIAFNGKEFPPLFLKVFDYTYCRMLPKHNKDKQQKLLALP